MDVRFTRVFVGVLVWNFLSNLFLLHIDGCYTKHTCKNLFATTTGIGESLLTVLVWLFYVYLIAHGIRAHGVFNFSAYMPVASAIVFFAFATFVLVDWLPILDQSPFQSPETDIVVYMKKFFGHILGRFNSVFSVDGTVPKLKDGQDNSASPDPNVLNLNDNASFLPYEVIIGIALGVMNKSLV